MVASEYAQAEWSPALQMVAPGFDDAARFVEAGVIFKEHLGVLARLHAHATREPAATETV